MYYTYILYNPSKDKFYIGQTNNLERRIEEHNTHKYICYTSKIEGKWDLLYQEKFFDRAEAIKRENFLKKQKNKGFYKQLCRLGTTG